MFTGIVEELGTIAEVTDQGDAIRLTVEAATVLEGTGLGDSISVNGCCLTVSELGDGRWTADLMQETLDKTSLARRRARRPGQPRARRHRRQAARRPHRPGPRRRRRRGRLAARPASTGTSSRSPCPPTSRATSSTRARSPSTASASPWSRPATTSFTVSLIPETLARTTLGSRRVGDLVNLEADVIAKHVEKLLGGYLHRPPRRRGTLHDDLLEWLVHGTIPVAGGELGAREVIGNLFGLASAILGMRRFIWAWPIGLVGNVLLFTVFATGELSGQIDEPLWGQAGRQVFFASSRSTAGGAGRRSQARRRVRRRRHRAPLGDQGRAAAAARARRGRLRRRRTSCSRRVLGSGGPRPRRGSSPARCSRPTGWRGAGWSSGWSGSWSTSSA